MTAMVAVLAASPFEAQQSPPAPPEPQQRFCLKGTDGKEACFTGRRPYDGPPTDPKVFEEKQQKLREELARRAEEARKRLEGLRGDSNR